MISVARMGSMGRLGNQMFQYACAYALSARHRTSLGISTHDAYRSTSVNQLLETFELKSATTLGVLKNGVERGIEGIRYEFHESGFGYDRRIETVPDGTEIRGYFQSEKYFKHLRCQLLEDEFKFKNHIVDSADDMWQTEFSGSTVCSIHIRRGDYKLISETHPNLDSSYYSLAVSEIPECDIYAVFSDEPTLAESVMQEVSVIPVDKIVYPDGDYGLSMAMMSRCNHHIIANSSYSWWGAWLSRNNGVVIAPKNWFGPKGPSDWQDIYCEQWRIL